MTGTFWAVGVGPGDPELMTLKAVRVLRECAVAAVPKSGAGSDVARRIAGEYLEGKPLLEIETPMTRDESALQQARARACERLERPLREGKSVAFLTLGDPCIYSTVLYLSRALAARGLPTRVVPGVPPFCAAAAAVGEPLCEGGEALHILPASYRGWQQALALDGCKVLMKSGKGMAAVREALRGREAWAVERATMEGERVCRSLDELPEEPSYFTIVAVPPEHGAAREVPSC